MSTSRAQWSSRLGFILAASGSAIGLGNIVFFSANAYKFGAGAFYVPYLVALAVVGLPVLILELGLGGLTRHSFPGALHQVAGRAGEFFGWVALASATFITCYYITILGWVLGMWVGALGDDLWADSVALPAFGDGGIPAGAVPNPVAFFFAMLSSWSNVGFVLLVWLANVLIVRYGAQGIERAVRVFVPLMWVFMIVMIVRGVTLPGGVHGVFQLFTPEVAAMGHLEVWRGAFSQIFFTLSLGFGIMMTYASYLPKKSDQTASAITIAGMNCTFEMVAGLAIFSLLFSFAMVPKASTLSMMFFIVPAGIASFPAFVKLFGVLFFTLLLFAGLSSSVSLVEAFAGALVDKFRVSRDRAVVGIAVVGTGLSAAFAWPKVIDPGLDGNGTLGLTLLDLIDHWAFSYGLLFTGLAECVIVGWVVGPEKVRDYLNAYGRVKVGAWFDVVVKYVVPAILVVLLGAGVVDEVTTGLYGAGMAGAGRPLAIGALLAWLGGTFAVAAILTRGDHPKPVEGALIALLASLAFAATLDVPDALVEDVPATVTLTGGDARTLVVTYFPGTVVEERDEIALIAGQASWTPRSAGLVTLSVSEGDTTASRTVAVRYAAMPFAGLLVFLIAGTLLFGGTAFGIVRMLQGNEEEDLPLEPGPHDT